MQVTLQRTAKVDLSLGTVKSNQGLKTERAKRLLADKSRMNIDISRAQASVDRAKARLMAAGVGK